MLRVFIFYILLAAGLAYAFALGRRDERVCAGYLLAATVLTRVVASAWTERFAGLEPGIFIVDALLFAALTDLALRSKRYWPLWMAGFQGYALVAHLARLVTPAVGPWMYAIGQALMGYPMILLLIAATYRSRRMSASPR